MQKKCFIMGRVVLLMPTKKNNLNGKFSFSFVTIVKSHTKRKTNKKINTILLQCSSISIITDKHKMLRSGQNKIF